jgi:hypothetical protein
MAGPAVSSRPDLQAYNHAYRLPFEGVVRELGDVLGYKLTAYLAEAQDVRTVKGWVDGSHDVRRRDEVEPRLRLALQAALMIKEADSAQIAQAWFQGLNPQLDDCSPARLLREAPLDQAGAQVLAAARAFVVGK